MPTLDQIGSGVEIAEGLQGLFTGGQKTASSSLTKNWAREDSAIQRKVKDARAAGVHPLYALGAATHAVSAGTSPTGSTLGPAIDRIKRRANYQERTAGQTLVDRAGIAESTARTREANARADTVEWNLKNSILKRLEGVQNTQQDTITMEPEPVRKDPVESKFVGPPRPRSTIMADGSIVRQPGTQSSGQELEDIHGDVMGNFYQIYNEWLNFKQRYITSKDLHPSRWAVPWKRRTRKKWVAPPGNRPRRQ